METDKFEKHIRTKLQDREIRPSANAWNQISKELNPVPLVKKRNYKWLGVAASVAVIIGIVVYNLVDSGTQFNSPTKVVEITDEDKPRIEVEKNLHLLPKNKVAESVQSEDSINTNLDESKNAALVNVKIRQAVVNNSPVLDPIKAEVVHKTVEKLQLSEAIINDKVAEIVNRVAKLEEQTSLTDAEVDSLLKRAQEELALNKVLNTTTSVDPMALLTDVEDELDQSFRDKIFERLKDGFVKVRSGVVENDN